MCRDASDLGPGINVTNYERLHRFTDETMRASCSTSLYPEVVRWERPADELTAFAQDIPYRLACTATPAPNDTDELANHAEFLGVMSGKEMLALFFRQDGNTTHKWRLKGHARREFWRWVSSWAIATRSPADLGFTEEAERFVLPELKSYQVTVGVESTSEDRLFGVEAQTLMERRQAQARIPVASG